MSCDLHTHSVFSDGTLTPAELLRAAAEKGLSAVALCDHNTVSGLPDFLRAAPAYPVCAVPGVEFSTAYGKGELHIVALFVPQAHFPAVTQLTELSKRRKLESNRKLAARLCEAGYVFDLDALRAATPNGEVNRAHIAAELTRRGYTASINEAFDTLLIPGGAFYEPPKRLDAFEVIAFIRSIGAVAVLAHPFLNLDAGGLERFLPRAVDAGLDAMEVYYATYDAPTAALAADFARRHGLLPSGGSDFHGDNKPDIALGTGHGALDVPDGVYEALRDLSAARRGRT